MRCILLLSQSDNMKMLIEESVFNEIQNGFNSRPFLSGNCIYVERSQCVQNKVCSYKCYLNVNSHGHHSVVHSNPSQESKNYINMTSISPQNHQLKGFGCVYCYNGSICFSNLNITQSTCNQNHCFGITSSNGNISYVSFSYFCDNFDYSIQTYRYALSFGSNAIMSSCILLRNNISALIRIDQEAKATFSKCIIKYNIGDKLIYSRGNLTIIDSLVSDNVGSDLIYTYQNSVDTNNMITKQFNLELSLLNTAYCLTEKPVSNDETLLIEFNINLYRKLLPGFHFFIN